MLTRAGSQTVTGRSGMGGWVGVLIGPEVDYMSNYIVIIAYRINESRTRTLGTHCELFLVAILIGQVSMSKSVAIV